MPVLLAVGAAGKVLGHQNEQRQSIRHQSDGLMHPRKAGKEAAAAVGA